jgi:hypothetical protein
MKNVDIIDFCFHKNKNLLFLVKSSEEINDDSNIRDNDNSSTNNQNIFMDKDNNPDDINITNYNNLNNNNNNMSKTPSNILLITYDKNNYRHTLINSDIVNYSFENIEISEKILLHEKETETIEININDLIKTEIIKIDSLLDIDCSDHTYISPGKRSFISLIDIKKNKISIIDI